MSDAGSGPFPPPPGAVLQELLETARTLETDYSAALRSHVKTRQWANLLAVAIDLEDVPDALFHDWELTDQHRQLLDRFRTLFDRVAEFLRKVKGKSGRDLGTRLTPVAQAVRLTTKIERLVRTLEVLQTDTLRYSTEGPPRRKRAPRTSIRARAASADTKSVAWGIVSVVVGIFALSAFLAAYLLGIVVGLGVAILSTIVAFLALKATESRWAPWLASVLTGIRR